MPRTLIAFTATLAVTLGVMVLVTRGGGTSPPAVRAAVGPDATRPGAPTDERIRGLQAALRAQPRRADGYTLLAGAYLQKVRETGDASFYTRAGEAVRRALVLAPDDAGALTLRGSLAMARHDFRDGLADARHARTIAPSVNKPFGVLVDALVELGRYDEAGRALQQMVDRRPDLAAYARVSYFRELHGDLAGAVRAMHFAVSAGGEVPENDAYVRTLLGGLELQRGAVTAARRAFAGALASVPRYVPAVAGLAQVDVARGRPGAAADRLAGAVERLPLPQYVVALGEAQYAAGRRVQARRSFALARAEQRLLSRAGVNTDVEVALFEADHGSALRALVIARRAWAQAPSVRSADAVGWALTRAGRPREGLAWARRALALGSRDASLRLHAAIAARGAGRPGLARRWEAVARAGSAALGPLARSALR